MADSNVQKKMVQNFPVELDPRKIDDYRVVEFMSLATDDEDPRNQAKALIEITDYLFGSKQWEKIIKHIRDMNDGFAPMEKVYEFVGDVFEAFRAKN